MVLYQSDFQEADNTINNKSLVKPSLTCYTYVGTNAKDEPVILL